MADFGLAQLVSLGRCGVEVHRRWVAVARDLLEHDRLPGFDQPLCAGGERHPTDHRFQAAARPAVTARAGGVQDDVPDFAREPPRPAVELAIDHDPAADPCPDGGVQQVAGSPPRAEAELAQGRRAGIVFDERGDVQPLRDRRRQDQVAETRDVRRQDHAPPLRIDQARSRNADGVRPLAPQLSHARQQLHHLADDALRSRRLRGLVLAPLEDCAVFADERSPQMRPAEIRSQHNTRHVTTLTECRLLSADSALPRTSSPCAAVLVSRRVPRVLMSLRAFVSSCPMCLPQSPAACAARSAAAP